MSNMTAIKVELKNNWRWKERNTAINDVWSETYHWDRWHFVRKAVPSEIHIELVEAGAIPLPYAGFNEHKIQWVGEREWLYALTFPLDIEETSIRHFELVFEGLDTFCSIYMNNKLIQEANNQFVSYEVKLDNAILRPQNTLLLHFKPAKHIAKMLESKYGRVRAGSCHVGDPSRVYVRKAQYDWRWDWGPEMMTVGPYRPIYYNVYNARIVDLHPRANVSPDLSPTLSLEVTLAGDLFLIHKFQVEILDPSGRELVSFITDALIINEHEHFRIFKTELFQTAFQENLVELWWPVGYGKQALYEAVITLLGGSEGSIYQLDRRKKKFGFRRVQLIQEPLEEEDHHGKGTTFLFELNNVRIFIGGSNWIPADVYLTLVKPDRLRGLLQLVKDGNQNMVRVWGGGIYESDAFYEICDELGLLVWQDFPFACGVYPVFDDFLSTIKLEAIENVLRLRHHPSLVLFCGNNEDYQQVVQWDDVTELPAIKIYEEILPEIVKECAGDIPYHRGSPYGGIGWDTRDPTVGDIHQWDVWTGQRSYHEYDVLGGRFVSEFGIPSIPDIRTVDFWLQGDESQRYTQSKLMDQHNKAKNHESRFGMYMNDNFRLTADFETHIYYTQIMQSDALSFAYRSWRRAWHGPGKQFTGGALVWQMNDSWPVTSWSIIDYFLRPKPAYYAIARELMPFTICLLRTVDKSRPCDRPHQFYDFSSFPCVKARIAVWGTNATLEERAVSVAMTFFNLESGEHRAHAQRNIIILKPNQSTEILHTVIPEPSLTPEMSPFTHELATLEPQRTLTHTVVVHVKLIDVQTNIVLSQVSDWPQPYRFLDFPDPGLLVTVVEETVHIRVDKPVKGLVLTSAGEGDVKWSDNCLDIVPGEPQTIIAKGLGTNKLRVAYMGKERARDADQVHLNFEEIL